MHIIGRSGRHVLKPALQELSEKARFPLVTLGPLGIVDPPYQVKKDLMIYWVQI